MKNGLHTMLKVDARRMFTTTRFYIFLAVAFIIPILILVMTTSVGGSPQDTGASMGAFTNAWQIIGSLGTDSASTGMDMTGMCNINLIYFLAGVLVCLFISDDFSSGYSKNLFTVRAKKGSYVASKTLIGFTASALLLVAFFIGTILGGKFAGLSFDLGSLSMANVVMCILAKIFLMSVFVSIFLAFAVVGKQRAWLSICLALFGGMLLFSMIPMLTPLSSGIGNVFMCLVGGAIFSIGIGAVSRLILSRTNLV